MVAPNAGAGAGAAYAGGAYAGGSGQDAVLLADLNWVSGGRSGGAREVKGGAAMGGKGGGTSLQKGRVAGMRKRVQSRMASTGSLA